MDSALQVRAHRTLKVRLFCGYRTNGWYGGKGFVSGPTGRRIYFPVSHASLTRAGPFLGGDFLPGGTTGPEFPSAII